MYQTHPVSESKRRIQRVASPKSLLPTKVSEFSLFDGNVEYRAFPRGRTSRWTALPISQWIQSLAAATETNDQLGPIAIAGVNLSDPSPPMVPVLSTARLSRMVADLSIPDDMGCSWNYLSLVDESDPMASMYTRQMSNLAGHLEASIGLTTTMTPVATISPSKVESWVKSYRTLQSRFQYTFQGILEQHRRDFAPKSARGGPPPVVSTETGDVRVLLDTLYEETIEKLKKQICDHQFYLQRGFAAGQAKKIAFPKLPVKPVAEASKHDLARFMTAWLRANFTNPYPDDEGLSEMAAQYGTTNQVISNWLINARTRKWRPALIKASEMGRPADVLLEDALNIFDGKPVREIDPSDYIHPRSARRQQEAEPWEGHADSHLYHDDETEYEAAPPVKRARAAY
jgi:Homeobox KN domain